MWNSDELFRLVKSLTKSEKRYFKLFTHLQKGSKKYALLFDAIDGQSEYDEKALKEQFRDEKFVRQFNVAKHYLYNLVLKSLRIYHSDANTRLELKEWLRNAEILRDKGLHSQAQAMLRKVIDNASVTGNYLSHIEALDRIHREVPEMCFTAEGVENLFAQKLQVVDELRNTLEYSHLYHNLMVPILYDFPRCREQFEALNKVMEDPLLETEDNAFSLTAKLLYHAIHLMYSYVHGNDQGSNYHAARVCTLHEEHPEYLKERPFIYLSALDYLLRSSSVRGDQEEVYSGIQRLEAAAEQLSESNRIKSDRISALAKEIRLRNLLALHMNRGEYDTSLEIIPELEECVMNTSNNYLASQRPWVKHAISSLLFAQGDHYAALDYNTPLALEHDPKTHHLVYLTAKMMNIMIHYELENIDLVEQLIRSVRKYVDSLVGEFQVERHILDILSKLINIPDRSQRRLLLMDSHKQLQEMSEDPLERAAFSYFDYTSWFESRFRNQTIAEIVSEKFRRERAGKALGKSRIAPLV